MLGSPQQGTSGMNSNMQNMALHSSPQLYGGSSMSSTTNQTFKVENTTGSPQPGPSGLSNIKMEIDSIENPQPGTSGMSSSSNLDMQNIPLSVNRSFQSRKNDGFIQSSGVQNVTQNWNSNFGSHQPGSSGFGTTSNRNNELQNFTVYENSQPGTSDINNAFPQNSGGPTSSNFQGPQPSSSNQNNGLQNFAPYQNENPQPSTSGLNNVFPQNSEVQTMILNVDNSQPSSSGFGDMSNANGTSHSTFYNENYSPNGTNYNNGTIIWDIECPNNIISTEDLLNYVQDMNPNRFGAAENSTSAFLDHSSPFNLQVDNQNNTQSIDPFNDPNILDISNFPNGNFKNKDQNRGS